MFFSETIPIIDKSMKFFTIVRNIWRNTIEIGPVALPFSLGELVLDFVVPAVIFFVSYKIFLMFLRRILKRTKLSEEIADNIVRWIRLGIRIVFTVFIVVFVGRLFGAEISRYLKMFYDLLSSPFFESGSTKISLITIILTIPVFYIASWIAKGFLSFINRTVLSSFPLDDAKKFTITNISRYGIMVVIIIIGLSIIGINLSSLTVIFGVLGIGVGFGLQGVVSNFFSGIVILFSQPIKEGDRVLLQNYEGIVVKIRLLTTTINTLTNESIIVPNSQLVNNHINNYSYEDRRIVITNEVQVAYGSDLDKVIEVLMHVAEENPYSLRRPEPLVRVSAFQDSGILMRTFTWVRDVTDKYSALSWNNLEIWRHFKKNGIEIPFPQMDLHVKRN